MSNNNKTFIIQPIFSLSEDSYLSGTTFDNNIIYYNMSNAMSAFTTNLSGVTTSPAGTNGEIQFNDSGSFGSSSNLIYTGTTLSLDGNFYIGNGTPTATTSKRFEIKTLDDRDGTISIFSETTGQIGPRLEFGSFNNAFKYQMYVDNAGQFSLTSPNDTVILKGTNLGVFFDRVQVESNAGSTFAPSITMDISGGAEVGFYVPDGLGSNTLGFITDRTERMRIGALGNVGIGTTSTANAGLTIDTDSSKPFISLPTAPSTTGTTTGILFGSDVTGLNSLIGGTVANGQSILNFKGGGTINLQILNTPTFKLIQSTGNGLNMTAAGNFTRTGTGDLGWNFKTLNNGEFVVEANVLSTSFIKSGSTSNDVLLGDGSTTPLSGISSVNIAGTPSNNQLAVWTNSNTIEGASGLLYQPNLFTLDAATSTFASPTIFGIANLGAFEAGRFQFGDSYNTLETAFGDGMAISSFNTLYLFGGRELLDGGLDIGTDYPNNDDVATQITLTQIDRTFQVRAVSDAMTANLQIWTKNTTDVATLSSDGDMTAISFIKSGGTSNDILLGDGSTTELSNLNAEVALYNSGSTSTLILDCSTFDSLYQVLTVNTDIQFTGTPVSGQSFVRTIEAISTAGETLSFSTADKVIGTFFNDNTTINLITINLAFYPTIGLRTTVLISQ